MKRYFGKLLVIVSTVIFFSCLTTNKILRQHFQSLKSKEEIVVVIFGDSISLGGGLSTFGSSYGSLLKPMLAELFKSRISLLNTSRPDESYIFAYRRIQEDILSFRPDIVFVMLGLIDALTPDLFQSIHKKNVNEFYSILKKSETFVIILTTTTLRDYKAKDDPRAQRIEDFNEITRDCARYYRYPLIDVARYMQDLQLSKPDEYRSLFSGTVMLNEKGNKYIAEYILRRITKILGEEY